MEYWNATSKLTNSQVEILKLHTVVREKMSDSSSFSSGSSQEELENPQPAEHNAPETESPPANPVPVVNGIGGENAEELQPQEEERTLTDHLNKRLLESFLARLDSGSMQLPPGARGADPPEEEDVQEFED